MLWIVMIIATFVPEKKNSTILFLNKKQVVERIK